MRESWTDRRLDDFAADTKRRFDDIDRRFDGVDGRLDLMERCMKAGFDRIDADIRELRSQTAAFQRTALQLGAGTLVTLFAGFAGIVTQL